VEFLNRDIERAKEALIYDKNDEYTIARHQELVICYETLLSLPDELDALKVADQSKMEKVKSYTDFGEK
jgi:hypothetical protein